MLKTEGEARGFQHFPADIKSVISLLVPFLKQYKFSNKNLREKPEVLNTSLQTLRV